MTDHENQFIEQYGPWAVVAGASEGTGRAFAQQLAAKGLRCVLIARRQAPLDALAEDIVAAGGPDCVTASIDLAAPDAFSKIREAVGHREIGLYVANAGADPNGSRFHDKPIDTWLNLVNRNVLTTMQACHHFGGLMRERGRGGLLLVNSFACYGGGTSLATYSASKAFDLCFAESLWSELRPYGVNVLSLVMSMTNTPAFNALLAEKGLPMPPGVASPDAVAALGIARLAHGPLQNWGQEDDEVGLAPTSAATRRERVIAVDQMSQSIFGEH